MQSKEEIEKDIKILKNISECFTYSMWSEDTETLRRVLQYIEQLESDKQKLIEKLEEDVEITKKQYTENTLLNIRVDGKLDTLEEILKILKGENDA